MKRLFTCLGLVALASSAAAQTSVLNFTAADIQIRPVFAGTLAPMPFVGGGVFRMRNATMVDLISNAYGITAEKVVGGPAWLGWNRYDVVAAVPPGTAPASLKTMLQGLLAERFSLRAHNGDGPVPGWALRVTNRPALKLTPGSGESGCKTQPVPASFQMSNGAVSYACRNMTMDAFAAGMRSVVGANALNSLSVTNQTDLPGAWNFDVTFRRTGSTVPPGEVPLYFFEALSKQVGLELVKTTVPQPALIVDNVNERPSDNSPGTTIPALPDAFEVADIKPIATTQGYNRQVQPGGRVLYHNFPLGALVQQAWEISSERIVGPKFLADEKFEIVAKLPDLGGEPAATPNQNDVLNRMLRTLLIERFKMVFHEEERPLDTYVLKITKAKLVKAEPTNRTSCVQSAGDAGGADTTKFTCRNVTMSQFAEYLEDFPVVGIRRLPVIDNTGLSGAWDFTFSFTPTAAREDISTPTGRLTLFEALENQLGVKIETIKRPAKMLVIDKMEQKPTQN